MKRIERWKKRIDFLPLGAIWTILVVCVLCDLFLLKKPLFVLSAIPLAILTILAGIRVRCGSLFCKKED